MAELFMYRSCYFLPGEVFVSICILGIPQQLLVAQGIVIARVGLIDKGLMLLLLASREDGDAHRLHACYIDLGEGGGGGWPPCQVVHGDMGKVLERVAEAFA